MSDLSSAVIGGLAGAAMGGVVSILAARAITTQGELAKQHLDMRQAMQQLVKAMLELMARCAVRPQGEDTRLDMWLNAEHFADGMNKSLDGLRAIKRWRVRRRVVKLVGKDRWARVQVLPLPMNNVEHVDRHVAAWRASPRSAATRDAKAGLFDQLDETKPESQTWQKAEQALEKLGEILA